MIMPIGFESERQRAINKVVNEMTIKKEKQDGIVYGFHGTSAKRAKEINTHGFNSNEVFIWDEDYKDNAMLPGKDAAREDDEAQYALIKVEMKRAEPDHLQGRPQWKGKAENITILSIEYFDL